MMLKRLVVFIQEEVVTSHEGLTRRGEIQEAEYIQGALERAIITDLTWKG